ncbi:unnamed protein product [marine sediment metagenome]|uniref:50S ribosomal protein L5 n=1 Tax=marine sediment metagenome TaxID=412755 RepID=X1ITW3_9ZZZZ
MRARLLQQYRETLADQLMGNFGRKNRLAVPKVDKICLNMGLGGLRENPKMLEEALNVLATITGQKAVVTKARKSVSAFRLREGYQVGARVTLRGKKMYEFLDRLINVTIPRIRDFRGMNRKAFDGRGNYSLGIVEQTVFPEIEADRVENTLGMDITIVTTARTDEESYELLKAFGFPFREN